MAKTVLEGGEVDLLTSITNNAQILLISDLKNTILIWATVEYFLRCRKKGTDTSKEISIHYTTQTWAQLKSDFQITSTMWVWEQTYQLNTTMFISTQIMFT